MSLLSSSHGVSTCSSYQQWCRSELFWGPVQPRYDTSVPHLVTPRKSFQESWGMKLEATCNALSMKEIQIRWLRFPPGRGFPGNSVGKESACNARDMGSISGQEDPLEQEMATHSSNLAWKIPWTEEPGNYSSWSHKEPDTTEWLTPTLYSMKWKIFPS